MLAKLCVLILSLGVAAATLLHLRQARLQAVHELTKAQLRMHDRDRDLYLIRTRIAERITPERVEQIAQQYGPLKTLGVDKAPTEADFLTPSPTGPALTDPKKPKVVKPRPAGARAGDVAPDHEQDSLSATAPSAPIPPTTLATGDEPRD